MKVNRDAFRLNQRNRIMYQLFTFFFAAITAFIDYNCLVITNAYCVEVRDMVLETKGEADCHLFHKIYDQLRRS